MPVSVESVREGLQRPQVLKIRPVEITPIFRAKVDVDLPLETPLEAIRRELAESSGYSGRGGIDILALGMSLVRKIQDVRRAHAEANARREVQEALAAFCATHDCSVLESGPLPLEGIFFPRAATTSPVR